jgi:hypothetical protein
VDEKALLELAALPETTRVTLRPGQVLIYQDHLPPGVFVLEKGELASGPDDALRRLPGPPPGAEAQVVPHPTALAVRSAATISAATEATGFFVPRTTIVADARTRRLLERLAGPAGRGVARTAP